MHFIIYAYTMKWGKEQILCIVVMGVGQEVIDFDGGSQMVLLSSYTKKKRKRKGIHHPIWSVIRYSLDS